MKKAISLILILSLALALLAGCCRHQWAEAQCNVPKKCVACGETEGAPLGHDFLPAACEAPRTCSRCGLTDGTPLGHNWQGGTCEAANVCTRCAVTDGDAPGHSWQAATCTAPETCSVCGKTQSEPTAHDIVATRFDDQVFVSTCALCAQESSEPMTGALPENWLLGIWGNMAEFQPGGVFLYHSTEGDWEGIWKNPELKQTEYGSWMLTCNVELNGLAITGSVYGNSPTTLSMADKDLYFQFIGEKNK